MTLRSAAAVLALLAGETGTDVNRQSGAAIFLVFILIRQLLSSGGRKSGPGLVILLIFVKI